MRYGPPIDPQPAPGWLIATVMNRRAPATTTNAPAPAPAPRLSIAERLCLPDPTPSAVGIGRDTSARAQAYGRRALEAEVARVVTAGEGERNHTLNRAGFALYQLVPGGYLDEAEVTQALAGAARGVGLAQREIDATLASALRSGYAEPRTVVHREPVAPLLATSGPQPAAQARQEQSQAPEAPEVKRPFVRAQIDLRAEAPDTPRLLPWLYGAGCFTVLQSEPGVGKSWLALWAVVRLLAAGYVVVYLDEEGGPELIHERLRLLGAGADAVDERLFLYCFEGRGWGADDLWALDAMLAEARQVGEVALAVLDSLPDFLAIAGLSEDKAQDVTTFIHRVCRRFQAAGVSVLMLDHLTKPGGDGKGKRGRYARGSGAKLAKSDATLLLETGTEFDANTTGTLQLWKTKDRRGKLEVPQLGKDGMLFQVKPSEGRLFIGERELLAGEKFDGQPRACAAAIDSFLLDQAPETWLSTNEIKAGMRSTGEGYKNEVMEDALKLMAGDGRIEYRPGPRGAHLYRAKVDD